MTVKVSKPQVDLREEINKALTLQGLKNQTLQVKTFKSDGRVEVGTNPRGYTGGQLFVHHDILADSTTKEELSDNAVLLLQPHANNSTHMAIGQVNNGDGMGIQVTNANKTADWDIALNPFGGNVGIGQIDPTETLHIGNANANFIRIHNAGSGDVSSGIQITRNASVGFQLYDNPQDDTTTFNAIGNMNFRKHGVGTRLYIDTNGQVGIGTGEPEGVGLDVTSSRSTAYSTTSDQRNLAHIIARNSSDAAGRFASISLISGGGTQAEGSINLVQTGNYVGDLTFKMRAGGGSTDWRERVRITSSGNLIQGNDGVHSWTAINNTLFAAGGIGVTSNTDWGLQMAGSTTQRIRFFTSNGGSSSQVGSITVTASATAYATSSDYRLKTDLQPMTGSIDRVKALNPINFAWIADGKRTDGFLAHEAAEIVPDAVTGEKDAMLEEEYEVTPAVIDDEGNVITEAVKETRTVPNYQGIDQSKLVPLLTAALQEAISKIEDLEQRLNDAGI